MRVPPYSVGFVRFWAAYPRKTAKGAAWKAWPPAAAHLDAILSALAWQTISADWTKDSGNFVPHAATYLRARRWEDEPMKVVNGTPARDIKKGWAAAMTGHPIGEQKL